MLKPEKRKGAVMAKKENGYEHLMPKGVKAEVWQSVVKSWRNGLSDREAAFRACEDTGGTITVKDIQKWKQASRDVAELCERLKDDLKATAKSNIAGLLRKQDDKTSRWYLEHKCPEEFSTRSAVAFENQVTVSLAEKEEALKAMVEQFENGR